MRLSKKITQKQKAASHRVMRDGFLKRGGDAQRPGRDRLYSKTTFFNVTYALPVPKTRFRGFVRQTMVTPSLTQFNL